MQASGLNRRELFSISFGAFACFATRSLYAEQVKPIGRIAFVRGNFGDRRNRKIFWMNPDGSDLRPLTDNEDKPGEDGPSWSPDSKSIAFSAEQRICVCKPDGNNLKILTPASGRDFGNLEVCIMNLDGTTFVNLTKNDARDSEPTWSPDGEWIAFARSDGKSPPMDICIMRADGSNVTTITANHGNTDNWGPSWGAP